MTSEEPLRIVAVEGAHDDPHTRNDALWCAHELANRLFITPDQCEFLVDCLVSPAERGGKHFEVVWVVYHTERFWRDLR